MLHHHTQHMQNMGSNLFACNENICLCHAMWYCMCSDVLGTLRGMHTQASWPPYVYVACQELLMDMPFAQAKQYLSKITASHFCTLNTNFANRNMLKRNLIAMHNENKAECNENFRICAEEPVAPLYKQ